MNDKFCFYGYSFEIRIESIVFKKEDVHNCKVHRRAKKLNNWLTVTFFLKINESVSQVLPSPLNGTRKFFLEQFSVFLILYIYKEEGSEHVFSEKQSAESV